MGILNVTPDSFSDGGRNIGFEVETAFRLIDEGADIIDIGGESTRPFFTPVSVQEEIERVLPAVKRISESSDMPISVDTMKPEVAEAVLNAGADIINDVTGLKGEGMAEIIAEYGAATVIMHMPREPTDVHSILMKEEDPMPAIMEDLSRRVSEALDAGIGEKSIIIDPGFGFGKTDRQNIKILENLMSMTERFPVLAGVSRKRFLSEAFPALSKDDASLEAARIAVTNGASIIRVHDVKNTVRAFGLKD